MTGKTNAAGGLNINGIIEQYKVKAGENISAGDFVEFINSEPYTPGSDTQLSTTTYSGHAISAVLLPNGNVFIAHNNTNSSASNLYGMVVTISGTTITAGSDTQLSAATYSSFAISMVLLPNGNVFIAHSGANYCLYGMVVTISGTTVTVGSDTQLSTTTQSGYAISAVLLPSGNVFIAHCYNNSFCLYGMVVTISDTTITAGSDTQLSTTTYSGRTIRAVLLPNGNVFIAHSNTSSSTYYLYGMVVTISGTTIAAGTDTQLSATTYSGYVISAVLLPSGNVFVAHSNTSNSTRDLYGVVVTISGTTVTAGADAQLSATTYSGYAISAVLLSNGDVLIAHSFSANFYLYGMVMEGEPQAKPYDTTINGVAKTGGADGATIDVYVPAA